MESSLLSTGSVEPRPSRATPPAIILAHTVFLFWVSMQAPGSLLSPTKVISNVAMRSHRSLELVPVPSMPLQSGRASWQPTAELVMASSPHVQASLPVSTRGS